MPSQSRTRARNTKEDISSYGTIVITMKCTESFRVACTYATQNAVPAPIWYCTAPLEEEVGTRQKRARGVFWQKDDGFIAEAGEVCLVVHEVYLRSRQLWISIQNLYPMAESSQYHQVVPAQNVLQ